MLPEEWQTAIVEIADESSAELMKMLGERYVVAKGRRAPPSIDAQALVSEISASGGCDDDEMESKIYLLEERWIGAMKRDLGLEVWESVADAQALSLCSVIVSHHGVSGRVKRSLAWGAKR